MECISNVPNKKQRMGPVNYFKEYIQMLIKGDLLQEKGFSNDFLEHPNRLPTDFVLMPDVIVWNIEKECSESQTDANVLVCPECKGQLVSMQLSSKYQMRQLYCTSGIKLLITTILQCSSAKKHEFLGYNPHILKRLPHNLQPSFKLFHRAGVTSTLLKYITQKITLDGLQVKQLHDLILKEYNLSLENKRKAFEQLCVNKTMGTFEKSILTGSDKLCIPSSPFIIQCFLTVFEEKETVIKETFNSVQAMDGFVFIDSSFQMTGFGRLKPGGNSVIKKCILLVVLNGSGQVMFWKFSTEADCLQDVISFINSYNGLHDKDLIGCYTSKCCQWSPRLKQEFGNQFIVKANLKMLLETFPGYLVDKVESPPNISDEVKCIADFEKIFFNNDKEVPLKSAAQNSTTHQATACPPTITNNLKEFSRTWNGVKNLSPVESELQKHLAFLKSDCIANGCYSGIPLPAYQDTVFPLLHSKLDKWTSNKHAGVGMSTAVVTLGLHNHNLEHGVVAAMVYNSNVSGAEETDEQALLDELINQITFHITSNNDTNLPTINRHLLRYLMFLKCYKNVSYCAPDLLRSPHLAPHFVSSIQLVSVPYFCNASEMNGDYFDDVEKLRSLINWSNQNSRADNAAFLLCFINHLSKLDDSCETQDYLTFLQERFSIDFKRPVEHIVEKMEKLLKLNDAHVPFNGRAFVECVSNMFRVVFLFVTNLKRFPIVPIYPREWSTCSPFVLVLIEDGHAMVMLEPSTLVSQLGDSCDTEEKKFHCRCGRGQAERNLAPKCVTIEAARYPSRCLCFRAGEPCSSLCDCRACANPKGAHLTKQRSYAFDQMKPMRRRNAHEAQLVFKRIFNRYFLSKKVKIAKDSWNYAEYILFEYILNFVVEEFHLEHNGLVNWSNITALIDVVADEYQSVGSTLRSFCSELNEIIRTKENAVLEKRYTERQEYVNTNFM